MCSEGQTDEYLPSPGETVGFPCVPCAFEEGALDVRRHCGVCGGVDWGGGVRAVDVGVVTFGLGRELTSTPRPVRNRGVVGCRQPRNARNRRGKMQSGRPIAIVGWYGGGVGIVW